MRSYGDRELVEVRRGVIAGQEVPDQFLWRGKVWKVREVIAHWVETGSWWEQPGVAALFGADEADASSVAVSDLLAERELWRVEASSGRLVGTSGVFDLAFDWADANWRLVHCID